MHTDLHYKETKGRVKFTKNGGLKWERACGILHKNLCKERHLKKSYWAERNFKATFINTHHRSYSPSNTGTSHSKNWSISQNDIKTTIKLHDWTAIIGVITHNEVMTTDNPQEVSLPLLSVRVVKSNCQSSRDLVIEQCRFRIALEIKVQNLKTVGFFFLKATPIPNSCFQVQAIFAYVFV